MDLNSFLLRYSPQETIARQQDAVLSLFSQHQRKAIIERELGILIEVLGGTLHEWSRQRVYLQTQIEQDPFFVLTQAQPFILEKGIRHHKRIREPQHSFEKTALSQIDHAARIANYYPHRLWQVLSALFRCLPMAFATTRTLFPDL